MTVKCDNSLEGRNAITSADILRPILIEEHEFLEFFSKCIDILRPMTLSIAADNDIRPNKVTTTGGDIFMIRVMMQI